MTDPWGQPPQTPPVTPPGPSAPSSVTPPGPSAQVPPPPGWDAPPQGPPVGWTPPPPPVASGARASLGVVITLGLLGFVVLGGLFVAAFAAAPDDLFDTPGGSVAAPAVPYEDEAPPPEYEPLPPPEDPLLTGGTEPLGSVWAASDGFWDVTYQDLDTRLTVLEDGAGEDCGDVRLSAVTPQGCSSWSSARLRGEEGTVEVDAYLLALDGPQSAATTAARDQADLVEADLGGQGPVLRNLVLQIGESPYVLYATVRGVRPGDRAVLQQHAVDALRATSLLATDPVVAQAFGD